MFHLFQTYVAIVFHLSVAKVDLDVGLLSEEERASAGAMVASLWKKRGSYMSGVEEAGIRGLWYL
jgi:hypothetical protein